MSLSKLNDQLTADICSFLDFKDINKLAPVNKGIKASLQRRGLDKPKVHHLCLGINKGWSVHKGACFVKLHSESDMPHKVAQMEFDEDVVTNNTKVLNWINKFHAIEHLEFYRTNLQDNAGWEDIAVKIRSVEMVFCEIKMSKETLMKFFKKFELVNIGDGCVIDPSFITDEFYIELARVGTTVHYAGDIFKVVDVTDATLDAISSRRIPSKLFLEGLITGFTFARVKKMIEDALKSEMTKIRYDFGYLKSDQYNEVHRFVSEEFERWAEGFEQPIEFTYEDYGGLRSYTLCCEDRFFNIKFCVYKPEEVLQNENVGEE